MSEPDRVPGFICLQRADQVKTGVWELRHQRREFCGRFLQSIFAEDELAGIERHSDGIFPIGFGHGDQVNIGWRPTGG